jgi:hypothetical protein
MSRFLLAFLLLTNLASVKSGVQIMDGTVQSKSVQLLIDGKPVQVELRKARVAIRFPSGNTGQADVTMLYEPQSRLFWWDYYQVPRLDQPSTDIAELLAKSRFFVTQDSIDRFAFSRPTLRIRQCSEHYSNLDEGQAKTLTEINNNAGEIEKGRWNWFREINLAKALGFDFMHLKGSASPFPEPKLREVTRRDGEWHLTFDGPNKDSAEVVLGDDYQVVSVNRSPASPG